MSLCPTILSITKVITGRLKAFPGSRRLSFVIDYRGQPGDIIDYLARRSGSTHAEPERQLPIILAMQ